MINTIKSNPKTSLWGIATILSEVIRNTPGLLDFLPEDVGKYIFGIASIICATLTVVSARDRETPAQTEVKELKKTLEREELKQEIKSETATLVKDAKAIVDAKIEPIMQVLPVVTSALPTLASQTSSPLVVDSIQTESITTGEIKDAPRAEVVLEDQTVEIPKI